MDITRTITVKFSSNITNEAWEEFKRELEETVSQMACDAAAASVDDQYAIEFEEGEPTYKANWWKHMGYDVSAILTEDGKTVKAGDRVFNYYDGHWGYIKNPHISNFDPSRMTFDPNQHVWFDVVAKPEDLRGTLLNGQRIATYEPKR